MGAIKVRSDLTQITHERDIRLLCPCTEKREYRKLNNVLKTLNNYIPYLREYVKIQHFFSFLMCNVYFLRVPRIRISY